MSKLIWWYIYQKSDQSEHEAKACSQQKAREKAREHVVFSFGFTSDWLRKCRFRLS